MTDQIIIACDKTGRPSGQYIPKKVGHTGKGKLHLAITILLYNNNGEVLLQKRKHEVFDDIWDLTGATHPIHTERGDESFEEATQRCLLREYGIKEVKLRNLGTFNYFATDGKLCENEHCAMMVGEYSGSVNLNPKVGYGCEWMDKHEFLKDIKASSRKYTPWAVKGVEVLQQNNFWKK